MLKAVHSGTFFGEHSPHGIPSDTDSPEIDLLLEKVHSLDSSSYPLQALKTILLRENELIGAGRKTLDIIRAIDNDTVFVVCGQQAGLFGGPLYTLFKAMHAVRLASILSGRTGKKVIPVFWVAADDHDFQEVNILGLRSGDGSKASVEYIPGNYREGMPVGEIILEDDIGNAIDTLADHCISGEASAGYLDVLRSSWKPGVTWSDAFASQLANMFSKHGLVLFNPRWDGIKKLFTDIINAELSEPHASTKLINERADAFKTSGQRKKALRKPEGSTNLFFEIEGIRYPLRADKEIYTAGESTFSREEMLDIVQSSPERFSPAAALRPVCQDAVLPVAAIISGPGERLYLKQIETVYRLFNVERSIPWPRASFTLIDRRTVRISEKEQISLKTLFMDVDGIRLELARKTFPEDFSRQLESFETTIHSGFERLAEQIRSIDSTLTDSVRKEKSKVIHSMKKIRERAVRAHKARHSITSNRLASVSYFLMPDGGPQERWFGIDAVLSLLDSGGFNELLNLTSPQEEFHRIVMEEQS